MNFGFVVIIVVIALFIFAKFGSDSNTQSRPKKALQKSPAVRIAGIQLDDDTTATPKKIEELNRLTAWMDSLVHDKGFSVTSEWGNGWPKEKKLRRNTTKGPLFVTAYIELAGQNYDKVGKIEINLYFDDRDTLLTLNSATARIDAIIAKEQADLATFKIDNSIAPYLAVDQPTKTQGSKAQFIYCDSEGNFTERDVRNWTAARERLTGHCTQRAEERTFRFDGIIEWKHWE
jgi:hypothetical protein